MATCPRCGEFLGEHHRCSVRYRAREFGKSAFAMLGGMVLSMLALYAVSDNPSRITVAISAAVGMLLGQALWTELRH